MDRAAGEGRVRDRVHTESPEAGADQAAAGELQVLQEQVGRNEQLLHRRVLQKIHSSN